MTIWTGRWVACPPAAGAAWAGWAGGGTRWLAWLAGGGSCMPFMGGAAGFCAGPWLPIMRWGSSAASTGACPWFAGCRGRETSRLLHL